MEELTKKQKLEALKKAMPNMSHIEACKLLGFKSDDYELLNGDGIIDFFKSTFGMTK